MHTQVSGGQPPPITLIDSEADSLSALALASLGRSSLGAALLLQELDRAVTVGRRDLPGDLVTMGSQVVFVDEASGEERSVQLVWPRDADMDRQRLSVLTPMGAALIGLRPGQSIEWPNRAGEYRRLRNVAVVQPSAAEA